jgi:ribosomal protein S18 acetylase RimI-like enzyme
MNNNIESIEVNIDNELSLYLVYRLGSALCGICKVTHLETDILFIDTLYVVPFFRGKGIGKHLVQAVVDIAKENNLHGVSLGVDDCFSGLGAFYEKIGFKRVYQYPSDNMHACIYSIVLDKN